MINFCRNIFPPVFLNGTFFFMVTLLERLVKLMMLTKGGMRYAFPPYVL